MTDDEKKICDLEKEIFGLKKEQEATAKALVLAANTGRANIALILSVIGLLLVIAQMMKK